MAEERHPPYGVGDPIGIVRRRGSGAPSVAKVVEIRRGDIIVDYGRIQTNILPEDLQLTLPDKNIQKVLLDSIEIKTLRHEQYYRDRELVLPPEKLSRVKRFIRLLGI